MAYSDRMSRRQGLKLACAGLANFLLPLPVLGKGADAKLDFASIASRAVDAGLISVGSAPNALPSNEEKIYLLATIVEASLEKHFDESQPGGLTSDSGLLLSRLNAAVKPRVKKPTGPSFKFVKETYRQQFDQCSPNASNLPEVKKWAAFFAKKRNRDQYESVHRLTGVPWHVVAVLHFREASANFLGHLHNGDPLRTLTRQVPKNHPLKPKPWPPDPWDPVSAWIASARDALDFEGFSGKDPESWTIEATLYRFEKYNGFGYYFHKTPSSYLWNFSNIGKSGGYASDGKWNRNYVSKQIGSAVLLKQMLLDGVIDVKYES